MAVREGTSFVDLEAGKPSASVRMLDYVMDFCFMVEDRLEELGMSRTELAEKLGKKPSSVTRVLSGSANITLQTIAEYDAALDLGIRLSRDESRIEGPGLTVTARGADQGGERGYTATEVAHA